MNNLISIIIVTYNSSSHIAACLTSIKEKIDSKYEVIIVDNNSSDKTLEKIKSVKGIDINVYEQQENMGFSRANNIGVSESKGDILFFLNPDTRIEKIDTKVLNSYLNNEDIGIVAPKLIMDNGKVQPSVMNLPSIKNAILEYWLNQKNRYSQYAPSGDNPIEVESVYGAALLMKKAVYINVGGFDDKYFLYFEDLDLCRKIRQNSLKIIYLPEFIVKHSVGISSKTNPKTYKYFIESAKKYHGLFRYYLLYSILRLRVFN